MAYNYLGLCNDVNGRLNEVALNQSNFATAGAFATQVKESVNNAIRDINQAQFNWPYNHNVHEETLEAGVSRYALPTEAKYVDYDTFRVRRDISLNIGSAKHLKQLTYDNYVDRYIDQEDETDVTKGAPPEYVVRTQTDEYVIVPMPDQDYEIVYEYFIFPVDMIKFDDVPTIPERFRHVIVDGAMYYAYMFRDNIEMATLTLRKFDEGIKRMRTLLVNENAYVRAI